MLFILGRPKNMTHIERITSWLAVKPKSDKEGLVKLLVLVGVLLFCIFPLVGIVFWHVFWVPWLFIILTSFCMVLSCVFLISGLCLRKMRTKSWEIARYLFFPFLCFWTLSFVMLCVCFVLANCGLRMTSSKVQFPTGDVMAIALSSEGDVYCANSMYCRVQVYDNKGSFLKGWFLPFKGRGSGLVGFSLDENNYINLVYRNKTHVYDSMRYLKTIDHTDIDAEEDGNYTKKIVYDDSGVFYKSVQKPFSRWQLVKGKGEKESVLISEPVGLWLVGGLFPCFPLMMTSILFWILLKKI